MHTCMHALLRFTVTLQSACACMTHVLQEYAHACGPLVNAGHHMI